MRESVTTCTFSTSRMIFTCLVCYKSLHEFRGAERDAYTFDAVHLNDVVWTIDFCKQGAQTRQSLVTVNDLQDHRTCFLTREVSLHEELAFVHLHGKIGIIFESV